VQEPSVRADRRTVTPAVVASVVFLVGCAVVAISFVAARGGLQMPVAAADASAGAATPTSPGASLTAVSTPVPTADTVSSAPPVTIPPPTVAPPSASPTSEPTAAPTTRPWESVAPGDPLRALPGCPDQPACFLYVVQRGDSLSGVASRYRIPVSTVRALNPELNNPGTIVVGQTLYLGRSPFLRLERCPDGQPCWLYTVIHGDGLASIADRFGLTVRAILNANPAIKNPNAIVSGQVIRLPEPA
jgi:nucleoid-associated protein YgaU